MTQGRRNACAVALSLLLAGVWAAGCSGGDGDQASSSRGSTSSTSGSGGGGTGGEGPTSTTSTSSGGGMGGMGGGGTGGNGSGGGGGAVAETGASQTQLVNSGTVTKSAGYTMVFTMGQPTQNQGPMTSAGYRLQGGLVGANGSLP